MTDILSEIMYIFLGLIYINNSNDKYYYIKLYQKLKNSRYNKFQRRVFDVITRILLN